MNCALKPRHNESVTWPFSEATCQIIGCVYFRRRSRRMSSDVWSLARPWRRFRRNWGLPGSYCMNGVGRGVAMARPKEGAEAEDGDRRSAGGRPGQLGSVRRGNLGFRRRAGQGEGADRRAGASGGSPTTRPRFFSQGLATCRRASGASPGAWRDQLFALIKDLSAAEKSQGENETTSAPEKAIHEVQHLCQLAQLSRASYHRHLAPRESKRHDDAIRDAIHRIALSDRFYGYRRIAEQLKREGLVVNSKRVRRLMRLDNLLSLGHKPFVPRTTDSAHGHEIVCDLTREAMLTAPDHVWVADITYIRLAEEFVYLAVVMDAFSRKVVGWALADHLQASLPLEALDKAT